MDAAVREAEATPDTNASPYLALDGFHGPLAQLLELARAHRVDIERISLRDLVEQLMRFLLGTAPLFRKAEWLVMAAWLLQLRAALLAPGEGRAQPEAEAEAGGLRDQLLALRDVQALASWLDRRPVLGRDVFARGRPEPHGMALAEAPELDVIEFLWASLALFDADLPAPDTAVRYRPPIPDLHRLADAVRRINGVLDNVGQGQWLHHLLPEMADSDPPLRRRSGWSSTFVASLELARQGAVTLAQDQPFGPVLVSSAEAEHRVAV